MKIRRLIPMLDWLPTYGKSELTGDLAAGLTVGVMLIPQGMAYAMIAGLPPIHGLYASIIPLILYAVFGTSRQLAVGPVAMVSLLIAAGIGELVNGQTDVETYIGLAVLLAMMVGILQLLLGLFRLGFLVNFLSHPVISGFTSAAALIIGLSQLKHLLGIDIPRSNMMYEVAGNIFAHIGESSFPTLLIGLGGILLIVLVKRYAKIIPAPLAAVVFGVLVVWILGLGESVNIVGVIPAGLPAFSVPALDFRSVRSLFPIALTIALVGYMQSIAIAKAIQARHKDYKIVPNQDLIGLGLANIGAAFFQAFPVAGGFARTAVNNQAGARTGMAAIISASLVALTLLLLTPLFFYLPKAILASIIMVAVFGLVDVKEAIHLWRSKRDDFAMLVATFTATLIFGIEEGILVGVLLSLGMTIFRSSYPHIAVLGQVPGTRQYRNRERFDDVQTWEDMLIVRLDAPLYFANIQFFKHKLDALAAEKGDPLSIVILDCAAIHTMDSTAIHALGEWVDEFSSNDITVSFASIIGPVRDSLHRADFVNKVGKDHFFLNVHDAVEASRKLLAARKIPDYEARALQHNK